MGIEIERKFLLRDASWRSAVARSLRMEQGYLGGDNCSVRVRVEGERAMLNVKSKALGASRSEYEFEIPLQQARQMLAEFCPQRVEKTRHYIEQSPHVWEIDEFDGLNRGLLVAEIELGGIDQEFFRPDWLGQEVTDDPRYYNVNLLRHPYAQWNQE